MGSRVAVLQPRVFGTPKRSGFALGVPVACLPHAAPSTCSGEFAYEMGPILRNRTRSHIAILLLVFWVSLCGGDSSPQALSTQKTNIDTTNILFSGAPAPAGSSQTAAGSHTEVYAASPTDSDAAGVSETGFFNHFVQLENVYMPSPSTGGAKTSLQALLQVRQRERPLRSTRLAQLHF